MEINKYIEVELSPEDVVVHPENVAGLLDYPLNSDDHLDQTIFSMIEKSKTLFLPGGGFIIKKIDQIDVKQGLLQMNGTTFEIGKIIAAQMKQAQYAALFFATIGPEVEKESKKMLNASDLFEGYTMDLIGSEAAEYVASAIHKTIKNIGKEANLHITNRFSPGYCNWSVSEQHQLFGFFGGNNKSVSLNDSALMDPIKSVSGIVGIGEAVKFRPYSCSKCSDNKCIYRNKKVIS